MATDVQLNDLAELLNQSGGSFVKALEKFVANEQAKQLKPSRKPTKADRDVAAQAILATKDTAALAELDSLFGSFIDLVRATDEVDVENPTEEQKAQLMRQQLVNNELSDFLQSARERVRQTVFDIVTEQHRAKGVIDPENHNGQVDVPELGKKFMKYNAGYTKATPDLAGLKADLGDELWDLVTDKEKVRRQIIPAHTKVTFNIEKFARLAAERPELLTILQENLVPGEPKSPSFKIGDL